MIEPLIIEATDFTPKILFDPGKSVFLIAGESRPESAEKFYEPVMKWMEDYSAELKKSPPKDPITLQMHMDYYNSATARSIIYIFHQLEQAVLTGAKVNVKWFYMEMDETMKEQGHEFAQIAKDLPFEMQCL